MKAEEIQRRFEEEYGKIRSIRIDQLGLDIYFYPITVEFEQHLRSKFKDLGSDEEKSIEAVFQRSLDSDGKRIWTTQKDREFIRKNLPSSLIARITIAMSGIGFAEAKKNSRKTKS